MGKKIFTILVIVIIFMLCVVGFASAEPNYPLIEEFNSSDGFTSTDPDVYIADGQVYWHVWRSGGQQYVYRDIPPFDGDVRLTVRGQVNGANNNCSVAAGIGDGIRVAGQPFNGIAVTYGYFGGGCPIQNYLVNAWGVQLDHTHSCYSTTGTWLWVNRGVPYTAELLIQDGAATLSVPGVGSVSGNQWYYGEYNTLFVGLTGGGDWPQCWGTIDSITIEPLDLNTPPIADAGGPYTGNEGASISLDGSASTDPDGDILTYSWTVDSVLCSFDDPTSVSPNLTCTDNGSFLATLVVDDGQESDSAEAIVTVSNIAPTVGPITVSTTLLLVETPIVANADFTDPGTADTHTALWNWGDETTEAGTVTQGAGFGTVSDSHTYTAAGVYTITLMVTDDDGDDNSSTSEYIVVFDPDGGFVTGGGWIDSPEGAYLPDPTLTGKVSFGFVSKYKKGASVPTGNTEFQFKVAGLNFHSSSYDWLVVTGSDFARFKGTGTINGEGDYKFLIWAGDGDPDTFRIKIWEEDELGAESVIYDNGFEQEISGGSIVVHTGK